MQSFPDLLCSLQPWHNSQFSPFTYTPSPQLHVMSVWCGLAVTADPRVGAVSTDPSLPCQGPDYGSNAEIHATKQTSLKRIISGFVKILNMFRIYIYFFYFYYFALFSHPQQKKYFTLTVCTTVSWIWDTFVTADGKRRRSTHKRRYY